MELCVIGFQCPHLNTNCEPFMHLQDKSWLPTNARFCMVSVLHEPEGHRAFMKKNHISGNINVF